MVDATASYLIDLEPILKADPIDLRAESLSDVIDALRMLADRLREPAT